MDRTNNNKDNSSTSTENKQMATKVPKERTVTQELSRDYNESPSGEEDDSSDLDYVEGEGNILMNVEEIVTHDGNNKRINNDNNEYDKTEDNKEKHNQQQVTQDVSLLADPKPLKNKKHLKK